MVLPTNYKTVPVSVATAIAHSHNKDIVVIVSYQHHGQYLHTTTFGVSAQDKLDAAALGEILAKAAGGNLEQSTMFEDFRDPIQAAEIKERRDALLAACYSAKLAIETASFDRYAGAALEPSYKLIIAAIAKAEGS